MDFAIEKVKLGVHLDGAYFQFRITNFKEASFRWFSTWPEVIAYLTKEVGEIEIK